MPKNSAKAIKAEVMAFSQKTSSSPAGSMSRSKKVKEVAAGLGDGHPRQGRADHLKQQNGQQQPAARPRQAHEAVADQLAADGCVAADQIGEEDALDQSN